MGGCQAAIPSLDWGSVCLGLRDFPSCQQLNWFLLTRVALWLTQRQLMRELGRCQQQQVGGCQAAIPSLHWGSVCLGLRDFPSCQQLNWFLLTRVALWLTQRQLMRELGRCQQQPGGPMKTGQAPVWSAPSHLQSTVALHPVTEASSVASCIC